MNSVMRLLITSLLLLNVSLTTYAAGQCHPLTTANTLDLNNLDLNINYFNVGNNFYDAQFKSLGVVAGQYTWIFTGASQATPVADCTSLATLIGSTVYIDKLDLSAGDTSFSVRLALTSNNNEHRLTLVDFTALASPTTNQAPAVSSISQQALDSVLYQVVDLITSDANGDTLSYELVSPPSGTGYSSAYINHQLARLFVTLIPDFSGDIALQYRATDGMIFSEPATVTLQVGATIENRSLGLQEIAPETYASFNFSSPNANLFGAPGAGATLPSSIDLSENFPIPGDQGNQSSCVGWAAAYALKSYHEKIEMSWSLNTPEHLFSPGFVYNQINGGQDQGSQPSDALELIVNSGVATWATMPYDNNNPLAQPSTAAKTEAANFKAASWAALSGIQDMKATLANRNPVLIGIQTYPQLSQLRGPNSVFNDYSGSPQGGHAVTVVGYDDNKFGGAFKVINSWSTSWGDNGYFWLPYDTSVLLLAMSLTDADNSNVPQEPTTDRTEPAPTGALPNLTVADWNMTYDNRPGGSGELTYRVSNTGTGSAPAGAYINLMLSTDAQFNANDVFIIYEQIPFELLSGETAFRDDSSSIAFNFPTDLPPGNYFVALWVDDLDTVVESNENDNVSVGSNSIHFENLLPDLGIEFWSAQVLDDFGTSALTYTVRNNGVSTAQSGWDINLVLSNDPVIGNGDERWLVYETVGFELPTSEAVFRDDFAPLFFNVFVDVRGQSIPSGNYYMAFWIDDTGVIAESNEGNNFSLNNGLIPINTGARSKKSTEFIHAYNGRNLSKTLQVQKINVKRSRDGKLLVTKIGKAEAQQQAHPKQMSAFDKVIFPFTTDHKMPTNTDNTTK